MSQTPKLSQEAEDAITKHNLHLSQQGRKVLSQMNGDPDRQTKYVVNPLVSYQLESYSNFLFENFKRYVDAERGVTAPKTETAKPKPAPTPKVEKVEKSDEDDGGMFSLFD